MGRARALLVLLVVAALLTAGTSPAGALVPFPPGDDGIRYFSELTNPSCGLSGITIGGEVVHYENVPAGAEVYLRVYRDGLRTSESGPFPAGVTGTGTVSYVGFSFPPGTYPQSVAAIARIDVGGRPTYLGGTVISCGWPGATPISFESEEFFPPCGVGDRPALPDVPASSEFCLDVEWALDAGVTNGYPDGGYHPTAPVTRQAMAAFLYRRNRSSITLLCTSAPFPDVPATHPFCNEILWLVGAGITSGYADGTFRPASAVSRQAMAAFLYRYHGAPWGPDPSCSAAPFPDVPTTHPFCGEIQWLWSTTIVSGYADGTFRPAAPVSRQAMAAFLHRYDARF